MKHVLLTLLTIIITTGLKAQIIDKTMSKVTFEIANMKVNTVEGSFGGMKGDVNFDDNNLEDASFDVTIDVASINTGIDKRDNHLRSADFFDAKKYPEIRFKSEKINKTKSGYETIGLLTIKDVTKRVKIPFTVGEAAGMTMLKGTLELKRKKYNVGEDVSTFTVGEDVDLVIYCVIKK